MSVLNVINPLFQAYIVYSAILTLKLIAVSSMTGYTRLTRRVFSNPEDVKNFRGVVKLDDPVVERTRRAHMNDLENIPPFWILGALYITTGPGLAWTTLLFRSFTVCRIIHTIVYILPVPQPSRAIAYGIPYIINWYMGIQVVSFYISAM
ncbi:PREDICTED: microsomal glutathione S-transferase 1-like [Papilio polytes]|uniref:microsomal glutathione S-transferase 1-like n=1 Tax=Papilio polytes TaxID=76194 RepID=UPI0006762962|nr:PREDICTED: microsomal glutathione S-transferase 1-like [Papilio polytes]